MQRRLSARRAVEAIRAAVRSGVLVVTAHARRALRDDGLDVLDLLSAAQTGAVTRVEPEGIAWRYRIEGRPVDLRPGWLLAAIFEIEEEEGGVVVITCFEVRSRTETPRPGGGRRGRP